MRIQPRGIHMFSHFSYRFLVSRRRFWGFTLKHTRHSCVSSWVCYVRIYVFTGQPLPPRSLAGMFGDCTSLLLLVAHGSSMLSKEHGKRTMLPVVLSKPFFSGPRCFMIDADTRSPLAASFEENG